MRRSRAARVRLCAPLTVLLLAGPAIGADTPMTVAVKPIITFVGGQVRTTVRTPRDERNRALRIVVEGEDYYASSDVQLDGRDAAATHQFTWKDLPGGAYRVDAILLLVGGEERTVSSCFAVLTGDGNEMAPSTARRRPPTASEVTAAEHGC